MSTERWDDARLDRLANTVESNSRAIENNNRLIESNARVIQALANVAAEAREEREQLFQRMDRQHTIIVQQQEEIRGLQTENRRILDILINQHNQGDNPTA
ncbi:MAG TPA: hypothetical protein VK211_12785 [Kamptonema sp.]|nr:hypothetical protein [Kamptonema sp.]